MYSYNFPEFLQRFNCSLIQSEIPWLFIDLEEIFSLTISWSGSHVFSVEINFKGLYRKTKRSSKNLYKYTAISRKVVRQKFNVHATIHCSWHCSCRNCFCCFLLALANIRLWPLVSFFQTSLNNSEFKTTHNTFRDCRVHFFRQPLTK